MNAPGDDLVRQTTKKIYFSSASLAALYGLSCRFFFGFESWGVLERMRGVFGVMTVAFIFLVPLGIGFLTAYLTKERSLPRALFVPIAPALLSLAIALMLAWEGLICVILWLPLFAFMSSLGGLLGYLVVRFFSARVGRAAVGVVATLPFAASFPESLFAPPKDVRRVETKIEIAAPPDLVWEEIVRVPAIRPEEHSFAWSHLIGFPKPVAALSEGRGVGSIREASFERGVVFHEKVTEFIPSEKLSFSIHADKNQIPARALDEHVTVGGPYFDVLSGTYELEKVGEKVVLHLWSEHRLSTHFNFYAASWTDFIMRDTQSYILAIVKKRAETRSGNPAR